jgi:hypothetical protein
LLDELEDLQLEDELVLDELELLLSPVNNTDMFAAVTTNLFCLYDGNKELTSAPPDIRMPAYVTNKSGLILCTNAIMLVVSASS